MTPPALRFLVVDDDEVDRLAVTRMIGRGDGVEVAECPTAEEALERCRTETFDLVLLDFHLPGHDGLWLLAQLRAAGSDVPVLMLTGQGDDQVAAEVMKAGAADYVPKSRVTADDLHHRIEVALRVRAAERAALAAQRALRESEELLRAALDAADLGAWEWHPSTGIACDHRCAALLGVAASPAPHTFEELHAHVHPDDRARCREVSMQAVAGVGGPFRLAFRVADTEPSRWVLAVGRTTGSGAARRLVGTVQDVTAVREGERLRREQEAFQRHLIGIASHDLRNPLSAVLTGVALLERLGLADPRARTAVGRIRSSGERAARLVRDLLDVAHTQSGSPIPIEPRATDLRDVLRRVVDELGASHPGRVLGVETRGDVTGTWDTDRIEQIVVNLATNALAHGAADRPVVLRARDEGPVVALEVHNEGRPVPADVLPRLFEPFSRGGAPQPAGIGLGLFIVRQLARAHGGDVEVASSSASGTVFRVRLPRAPQARPATSDTSESA